MLSIWSPAAAQETIVNVRNAGHFSCESMLSVVNAQGNEVEKTAFLQWTAAYATAAARSNGLIDIFPIGDTWELVSMVTFVCRESPQVSYETALLTTISRLRPYWIRVSPEVLTLNDPLERTVQYYVEAVKPLQEALIRYGAIMPADGVYGNQTGNMIREMNIVRGSAAWMTPDGEFLYQLTRPSQ